MPTVVLDMDGVLYRGTESLPDVAPTINTLRDAGFKVGFLTNNSGKTRGKYIEVFAGHGIQAEEHEIMTSGEATARHLVANGHSGRRVYVIGGEGLVETLAGHGFDADRDEEGAPCDLVVIGWDRSFTFNKIVRAQFEILQNGAKLIATNADAMFPAKEGRVLPGAGSMVSAVETASGTRAEVIGKPATISLKYLLDDLGVPANSPVNEVWVAGDRLDTDIACGNAFGARTVCVTTGITTREQAESATGQMRPDYVIDSLSELLPLVVE